MRTILLTITNDPGNMLSAATIGDTAFVLLRNGKIYFRLKQRIRKTKINQSFSSAHVEPCDTESARRSSFVADVAAEANEFGWRARIYYYETALANDDGR